MKQLVKSLQARYHYAMVVFKELVKTNFKLRYQGSFLGVIWSVLQPLMLFAVMYVVFVKFLKFSDGTPTFPISLLCGTCLWQFFSESTSMGMRSIVERGDLLRKIHFPNYIIVASTTMGSMISLAINLGVVILFGFFAHAHYTWRVLLVIPSIIQLYAISLGVAVTGLAVRVLPRRWPYLGGRAAGHVLRHAYHLSHLDGSRQGIWLGRQFADDGTHYADNYGYPAQLAFTGICAEHLDDG